MVNQQEFRARIQEFFRFGAEELGGIVAAMLMAAFIFSFRDWGGAEFNLVTGLKHFISVLFVAALAFFFRISCQKLYGLSQGYKAKFKVWWIGLVVSLILAFLSLGWITLVLAGGIVSSFLVRQRLGEYRYGFSYTQNAVLGIWGIIGNLIMAMLMAVGFYFFPESYFFQKGILLNIVMAFCALLPLPSLEGLAIFFGSRLIYAAITASVLATSILLLSGTRFGLLTAITLWSLGGIIYTLIGSEK